jgi:lipoate-protein ligase A
MQSWRVIDTGTGSGAYNMGVDEVLGEGPVRRPVLRLYDWDPPAISYGYGQRPEREVDPAACQRMGVDLVRRATGGRAVLHWEELTYSVVCDPDDPRLGGGIEEMHRAIGECLAEGLRLFGAEVDLERVRRRSAAPRGPAPASPCFSSTARWELKCRGRKLVGSAQRRFRHAVLQHGSILLGRAHERLPQLMCGSAEERRVWTRQLEEGSIDLGTCLARPVERGELAECLVRGFARRLGVEMQQSELDADEARRAVELAVEPGALEEIGT